MNECDDLLLAIVDETKNISRAYLCLLTKSYTLHYLSVSTHLAATDAYLIMQKSLTMEAIITKGTHL